MADGNCGSGEVLCRSRKRLDGTAGDNGEVRRSKHGGWKRDG